MNAEKIMFVEELCGGKEKFVLSEIYILSVVVPLYVGPWKIPYQEFPLP